MIWLLSMDHIWQLRGKKKAELTLVGVTESGNTLYAMGYLLIDPDREKEKMPNTPEFLHLMRPKPYRRGNIFRAETGIRYKSLDQLEIDRFHLYAVTLETDIKFERMP